MTDKQIIQHIRNCESEFTITFFTPFNLAMRIWELRDLDYLFIDCKGRVSVL